jgi:glycine cleavage system aminomethyltransferase T
MLGDEPIFRNGILVGYVTSCRFGWSLNKWVGMAVL